MHCRQASSRRRLPLCRTLLIVQAAAVCLLLLGASAASAETEVLRVLKLRHHELNHPHRDTAGEFRMLSDFARQEQLELHWIDAIQTSDLSAKLQRGEGDIVIADLGPETAPLTGMLPSISLGTYRNLVYGRSDLAVDNPLDLVGLKVAAPVSSPLWTYLNDLSGRIPGLEIVALPDNVRREAILAGINARSYDAAIVSARMQEHPAEAFPRVKKLFELSSENTSRWFFAAGGEALRERLDAYLLRYQAMVSASRVAFGDLDRIGSRHVLRVVTRVDPGNYFVRDGSPAGFEFELVREFSRHLGLNLEFLVAETDAQILDWLRRGIGDVVTTRINSQAARGDPALTQSVHYHYSPSVIVHRAGSRGLAAADLAGRRVGVVTNSMEHRVLGELLANGLYTKTRLIRPDRTVDELARLLIDEKIDAALVDAQVVSTLLAAHPGLAAGASVPNSFDYAWTLRAADNKLERKVNEFLREQHRSAVIAMLADRYTERAGVARPVRLEPLSPFDDLVRRHAAANGFDWRLIVAQMYLESRFDPRAESRSGGRGLMQLQPATAKSLGVHDPFDPESGIRGGVVYLEKMRQLFTGDIAPRDRTWFALAAYNIGYAGVERARRRARAMGLDDTRWFGHVEQVMRLLAREDGRYRWGTTVNYVRTIRSLYNTYHRLHETLTVGVEADWRPAI